MLFFLYNQLNIKVFLDKEKYKFKYITWDNGASDSYFESDIIADSANGQFIIGMKFTLTAMDNLNGFMTQMQREDVMANMLANGTLDDDDDAGPNTGSTLNSIDLKFYTAGEIAIGDFSNPVNGNRATYWWPLKFTAIEARTYYEGEVTIYYGQPMNRTGGYGVKWINL